MGKVETLTVRLTSADRKYVRRIARIRRLSMAQIVAEMIDEHRQRTLAAIASVQAPANAA